MEDFAKVAVDLGATTAKVIDTDTVVTAPWTLNKCKYGCKNYNKRQCCPPIATTYKEMQVLLDTYEKALLIQCLDPYDVNHVPVSYTHLDVYKRQAVGGGSVIDTAKGIAHGVANPDTDIWDFWEGKAKVEKSLPVGVILTISAAGSEMSNSAVLTNEETGMKRGLSTDFNRPKFAIMDPELTYTLPDYQVGCGVVDIMMHTMDRYFTDLTDCQNDLTDEIAEALLLSLIHILNITIICGIFMQMTETGFV